MKRGIPNFNRQLLARFSSPCDYDAPVGLATGTRIGSYEVVGPLGKGGMGEVYRARDTRLGRDVALKVLPDAFAHDAERRARFEREARTLAVLNDPHIAHLRRGRPRAGDGTCRGAYAGRCHRARPSAD
jgi:serine/threonine protein kinase